MFNNMDNLDDDQKQEAIQHARTLFNDKEQLKELHYYGIYLYAYCEVLEYIASMHCTIDEPLWSMEQ